MKTYNLIYEDFHKLSEYISKNNISYYNKILIQIFSGIPNKDYILQIKEDILNILPKAKIIGVTSSGEIFNGSSVENKCVISITTFNNVDIKTYAIKKESLSDFQCGQRLGEKLFEENTKAIIVFGNKDSLSGEEFIQGINSVVGSTVVAGGLTGSLYDDMETLIFNEKEIIKDGAVGVSLNGDELNVYTDNNFNWIPIGKEHIITKVNENIIETINDMPARYFYEKYIGVENINKIEEIGIQFPMMINVNGRYISKPISGLTESGGIKTSSKVNEGEKIRLGYGNLNYILKSTKDILERIEEKPIETIFIYSCIVRKLFLKSHINIEMQPLSKEVSVGGFFTFGEFNNVDNSNVFSTETMTLLGLSENKDARITIDKSIYEALKNREEDENFVLYNLIKATGDELNDLNKNLEEKVEEKTQELKEQYYTDLLTGLPNRNRLTVDISKANYRKLALIDVNSFREINDFYGNKAGDVILVELAKLIKYFATEKGLKIYRIDADVYALASDNRVEDSIFKEVLTNLQKLIKQQCFFYKHHKFFINASVGIGIDDTLLIEKADMALNYAKKHQKTFQIYDPNLHILKSYEKNLIWTKKINDAIEKDGIVPYFQPIINNRTGKIEKFESLIRMLDDDKVITPYHFMSIAKKAKVYNELTRIVISKTIDRFKNTDYEVSINLSVEDILDAETREFIIEKLRTSGLANQIIFEIVESEGIENFSEVINFIDEVKRVGVKVAIDDFGTGYSNFIYLMKLKVDYIKIDGSIIKNVNKDKSAEVVAETIVSFAKKLGINTVAEFVEDEEIYKKVNSMGIEFSQGYYFSEPKKDI